MSIMVSIACNTYNHENYIAEALEGFVNQKTNFEFEILVYDDASTDATPSIIQSYAEKYPHLIKAMLPKENLYSKGLSPFSVNIARAAGKYIALCEGDDYWIDENKLQKQVDYMESHPDCSFCFTNGYLSYGNEIQKDKPIIPYLDRSAMVKQDSQDYDLGELELMGSIPTASYLYRSENPMPEMPKGAFRGDAYIRAVMTSYGYAHYIPEPTCVYRREVPGSATAVTEQDSKKKASLCDRMILLYEGLGELASQKKDQEIFQMRICQWKILKAYTLEDYQELKRISASGELKLLKYCNRYTAAMYLLQCRMPRLHKVLRSAAKKKLKGFNR